jgi:hypothetical protein
MRSVLAAVLVSAVTLSGCGAGGSRTPTSPTPAPVVATPPPTPAPTSNPNVIGTWTGTMRSQASTTRSIRITMTGAYHASSYLLSGNWAFINTSEGADISGLVQSNPFSLRINASTSSPSWCSYNVTLTASGNTASGNYSTSVCSGRSTETGTITLAR